MALAMTCEEFYFQRITPAEASAKDYRDFFDLLWRTYGEEIFRHAYSRLGNVEDARDVCADAFVRAMRFIQKNPGRIPLKVNFRAWLRVIARHLIDDRFRKALVCPVRADPERLETAPVETPPENRMITEEDVAILRECLEALTERARLLVRLRDMEGLSEKAIAAQLHCEPNAVYVALHRARKSLRECVSLKQSQSEA